MSTLKEFIDRMFADRPARNDWYADTNVVWGRIANGFIELDERKDKHIAELEQQLHLCYEEREQQNRIARRMLERAGETMDSVRVFVTSSECIKQPEGEEWYDGERESLFGLPYYSCKPCPDEV